MLRVALVLAPLAACRRDEEGLGPADLDHDGFVSVAAGGSDCDDWDPAVHPDALDVCNGLDDDCSGSPDDDPAEWPRVHFDADGDGFGGEGEVPSGGCQLLPGFTLDDSDCDDDDPDAWPGAAERCNGEDDDCETNSVEERAGAGVYETIQAAVDDSLPNGVITVCDGVWQEAVRVPHDLTIASVNGAPVTVVDGGGAGVPFTVDDGVALELVGLTIRNGRSPGFPGGGGVNAAGGGPLTVTDCVFEQNHAGRAGAIAANALVVTGSTFRDNTADERGGALQIHLGPVSISGSTFTGNTAEYGGAIDLVEAGAVDLTDCTFDGNDASSTGGALIGDGVDLTLVRSTFTGNSALFGGAMNLSDGIHVADDDTLFEGNTSSNIGGALALWSLIDAPSTWTGGTFRENVANGGGAISVVVNDDATGSFTVARVLAEDNTAVYYGGGVQLTGYGAVLFDSVVTGNSALMGGGAYTSPGDGTLIEVELVDNEADWGAGLFVNHGDATLDECTVTGNVALTAGGAVYVEGGATMTSTISDYSGNSPDDVQSGDVLGVGSYRYGLDATFTCDGSTTTCL